MKKVLSQSNLTVLVADRLEGWMRNNPALDTQKKLADAAGVGQTTVSRLLKKQVSPTLDVLDRICIAFGRNAYELIKPTDIGQGKNKNLKFESFDSQDKAQVEVFAKYVIDQYFLHRDDQQGFKN